MTKKRYVAIDENNELHATGLEMKRSDWTLLATSIQEELLKKILLYDISEEEFNDYLNNIKHNIKKYPIEYFIYEKIIDCRKEFKVNNTIVKAWKSCGFEVAISIDGNKKTYKCVAPRGEALLGIRWIFSNKGTPIGIPEDADLTSYKTKIGYEWYYKKQVLPIIKRIADSIDYHIGSRQSTLDDKITYL